MKSKERSDGPTRLFIVSKDKYKTGFKPFVDVGVGFCRELCKVIGNVYEDGDILNDSENTKRN